MQVSVAVRGRLGHGHQMQTAVAHPGLGHHRLGEGLHLGRRAAQDHHFDAVIVIQVGVGGGHRQRVVGVLHVGQPQRELALVVVVDVAQGGDARPVRLGLGAGLAHVGAQQIAEGFGAVGVAALGDEGLEGIGQIIVQGNGEAFHAGISPQAWLTPPTLSGRMRAPLVLSETSVKRCFPALLLCLPLWVSAQSAGPASGHAHAHHAAPVGDTRQAVAFPAPMRAQTLANMRDHLLALTEIQEALARRDFDGAGQLAERRLGMSSLHTHGAHDVAGFMPPAMQALGTAMHRSASQFAVVAQEASVTGDLSAALAALAKVGRTCVSCHEGFRLETAPAH